MRQVKNEVRTAIAIKRADIALLLMPATQDRCIPDSSVRYKVIENMRYVHTVLSVVVPWEATIL